jgi:hypothetical protein
MAPLKAKRRTKLHKKIEVRERRNIKSPYPIKEGFDQNVLVLVLRLFMIFKTSCIPLSPYAPH